MTHESTREKTQPVKITAIIPVHNGSDFLERCLDAVTSSDYSPYECIVVNDASTDSSTAIARQFPVRVLDLLGKPSGPAYARNRGAEMACGEILFFVDADIVLAPGVLRRIAKVLHDEPDLAAIFGSYDSRPEAKGIVSQYRNLLHHFVHQNGNPEAATFWAGCGAVRRSVFEQIGGFDEKRFPRSSIEDIELGYRLRAAGYRILLDKAIQGKHLKRWGVFSLIRTDITRRAIPWSRLIMETKNLPNDLNLRLRERTSCILVVLACMFLGFGVMRPAWLGVSGAALLGSIVLNRQLYAFFFWRRGLFFAAACMTLHLLYYLYSGISYFYVWIGFWIKRMVSLKDYRRPKTRQPAR